MGVVSEARRLRVLVADDRTDTCESFRLLFEAHGYEVCCASNGAAAIEAAARFNPDVCLLDIDMPVQNGYSVARELRAVHGWRCPYLIAISGLPVGSTEQLVAGFDRFVRKPADPRELVALVRLAVQMRRRLA
jgi:DNA-binding response OmpR family regulator